MTTQPQSDPTAERIAHSGADSYVSDTGLRTFKDEPIQRLAARGKLDKDKDINAKLFEAAERYWENYYLANMSPLASFDPTRVFSGGGEGGCGMPVSERQAIARSAHRSAIASVETRLLKVVDRIVLQFQGDLVTIGREASGAASPDVCRTVAMERLVAGLWALSRHYGIT